MNFATHGRTDQDILQQFIEDLPTELEPIELLYERAEDLDHLHVWIISPRFADQDSIRRSDEVWQVYRRLPLGVLMRISLLFKLTPAEFAEEYGVDLDHLPEDVHRLSRPA